MGTKKSSDVVKFGRGLSVPVDSFGGPQRPAEGEPEARHEYQLPGSIGMALMTDRGLFARAAAKEVLAGTLALGPKEAAELCHLIGDMINDRRQLKQELAELKDEVEALKAWRSKLRDMACSNVEVE